MVFTVAPDGITFCVYIATTPNVGRLTTDNEDGRIVADLYYVEQTNVKYTDRDEGQRRDINIKGTFRTYDRA